MKNIKKVRNLIIFLLLTFSAFVIYTIYKNTHEDIQFLIFLIILVTLILVGIFIIIFKKLIEDDLKIKNNLISINNLKMQKEKLLARYEYAIEGSKDGLWDWNIQDNSIYFSKSWKEMLGFEDNEISNSLEEWEKRVHPDDLQQAYIDIEKNQKQLTSHYQNIHRMKYKDGSWVWILDRGKTYFDRNNKAIRMVGFHSNITELKNLEMDLKKVKKELQEFKFIIESAPISILITDVNANIIYVNPQFCKTTLFTEEEALGKNPRMLKFEDDNESREKVKDMWRNISNKKTWGGIFKNRRKDGSECWETATVFPILNSKGEIINYLGILREITKELYLEKELKEKEEMMIAQSRNAAMGEMISMIAHQWRQPITTISMNANNIIADIQLGEFDTKTVEEIAKNIGEQTQFLSKTIDDFRNFFKEDKDLKVFKISELLNELNSILMASINNNNITFNVNYNEDFEINSHKRELLQVLLNIVKNAKEALVENKTKNAYINIDISKINDNIKFTILDNAGGIKEEYLNKIFDAYFTTKNDINGTGLGLYMSKIIIEKHLKGEIEASNEKDGAIFKILIKKDLSY